MWIRISLTQKSAIFGSKGSASGNTYLGIVRADRIIIRKKGLVIHIHNVKHKKVKFCNAFFSYKH
jgi:hypothetical protein